MRISIGNQGIILLCTILYCHAGPANQIIDRLYHYTCRCLSTLVAGASVRQYNDDYINKYVLMLSSTLLNTNKMHEWINANKMHEWINFNICSTITKSANQSSIVRVISSDPHTWPDYPGIWPPIAPRDTSAVWIPGLKSGSTDLSLKKKTTNHLIICKYTFLK